MLWSPFDSAVDAVVLEVFIDLASIARDSSFWCPAVYVASKRVRWVSDDIHGRMGDAFGWGPDEAMV